MSIAFVVNLSVMNKQGVANTLSFVLGDYASTPEETAYKQMKNDVISTAHEHGSVNWVAVGFMLCPEGVTISDDKQPKQLITAMTGTLDWFSNVEYFRKIIGGAGSSDSVDPVSHGFIDSQHGIRVEFENGTVWLSSV